MHRNTYNMRKNLISLYVTGYHVTYCLWSPQLARGTEQTAQCQSTRPFSRVAIGKGSDYTGGGGGLLLVLSLVKRKIVSCNRCSNIY